MSDQTEVDSLDIGQLERRLVRSADLLDVPSEEGKTRVSSLMTLAVATAVVAGASNGAGHALVAAWKVWVFGTVSVVAVLGGIVFLRAHVTPAVRTEVAVAPAVGTATAEAPAADTATAVTPAVDTATTVAAVRAPSPAGTILPSRAYRAPIGTSPASSTTSSSDPSRAAAPVASAPSATLAEQIAMLDRARELVEGGRASQALPVLGDFERRFPNGTLAQEATVMRIEALFTLGRTTEAASLANRFLAAHPASSHREHLRRLMREAGLPTASE